MFENKKDKIKLWKDWARVVFQDRVVSYEYWHSSLTNTEHVSHRAVFEQSLMMLPADAFICLLGNEFVKKWPEISRTKVSERPAIRSGKVILGGRWRQLMTGISFSSRRAKLEAPLSRGQKETFLKVAGSKEQNIYRLAKNCGRAYNRVWADVKLLHSFGLVEVKAGTSSGRKTKMVSMSVDTIQDLDVLF
jgi:predicted transcriptional regulator